jgi:hypothetical protein
MVVLILVVVSGCGKTDPVELVKSGVLEFNQTVTVGQAFDNWRACDSSSWSHYQNTNGATIVMFSCFDNDLIDTVRRFAEKNPEQYKSVAGSAYLTNCTRAFYFTIHADGSNFEYVTSSQIFEWSDGKKQENASALPPNKAIIDILPVYQNNNEYNQFAPKVDQDTVRFLRTGNYFE